MSEELENDLRRREKKKGSKSDSVKKKEPIQTSFIEDEGMLVEQIYEEGRGSSFAAWDGKSVEYIDSYEVDGEVFVPNAGEDVQKGVVLLPSKAEEYESEEKLLEEIEDYLRKWVGVSESFYKIGAQYILTSWLYDRFDTINYLRALGDTGTGKSRFMNTFGGLCYKYINIAGAVRAAPVYRVIERWKGTLGIEEADFEKSDETQEMIKIINCGFEKNNPVMRCDKENLQLQFFTTFGPKVIATRKNFTDAATEARCLTERMFQDGSKPDTKTKAFYDDRLKLRNKLLMFRFKNYHSVDISRVLDIDLTFLEPRLRQASRPFLAMVWDKPTILEQFKSFLRKYQEEIVDVRGNSFEGQIVSEIKDFLDSGQVHISPSMLAEKIGDKTNARSIGRHLRGLGLDVEHKKVDGKTMKCLILNQDKLQTLFKRYVSGYEVTKVTLVYDSIENRNQQTELGGYENGSLSNSNVTNVTIVTDGEYVQDSPKDLLVAFIKARQGDEERNGNLVLRAAEQLGCGFELIRELASEGIIYESPADHWRVLD